LGAQAGGGRGGRLPAAEAGGRTLHGRWAGGGRLPLWRHLLMHWATQPSKIQACFQFCFWKGWFKIEFCPIRIHIGVADSFEFQDDPNGTSRGV